MKKILVVVIAIVLVIGIAFFAYYYFTNKGKLTVVTSRGEEITLNVMIADETQEKIDGLSVRDYLNDNEGMYFVHSRLNGNPYWMYKMKFPIDIIFLNENNQVVYIERGAKPCVGLNMDDCPFITPTKQYKYVLEVVSGFSDKYRLNLGDKVVTNPFTFAP